VTLAPPRVNTGVGDNVAVSDDPRPGRPVQAWPCQSVCVWEWTGVTWNDGVYDDLRVFACRGCGSEWVRTEPWTPIDSGGDVPPEVDVERRRR
jgi:hypothetical protein